MSAPFEPDSYDKLGVLDLCQKDDDSIDIIQYTFYRQRNYSSGGVYLPDLQFFHFLKYDDQN